jgi:hypothetical protein
MILSASDALASWREADSQTCADEASSPVRKKLFLNIGGVLSDADNVTNAFVKFVPVTTSRTTGIIKEKIRDLTLELFAACHAPIIARSFSRPCSWRFDSKIVCGFVAGMLRIKLCSNLAGMSWSDVEPRCGG